MVMPDLSGRPPPRSIVRSMTVTGTAVLALWVFNLMAWAVDLDLARFGVRPRDADGLVGLLTGPLVHGSLAHLVSNTLPLLLLGTMLHYGYPQSRRWALIIIWLGSGLGVWFTARSSFHIGASGITHGLMFFLLLSGLIRRDRVPVVLAMLAFFLYGGMMWTVFPTAPQISFESHAWGAVAGAVAAGLLRHRDPPPPPKRYSWDREPETDDPVIGDLWQGPQEGGRDDRREL